MARNSLSTLKIIGLALLVIGIALAAWGYHLSGSLGSQLTQALTGSNTDKVMTFYIGGAVSFVLGLVMLITK